MKRLLISALVAAAVVVGCMPPPGRAASSLPVWDTFANGFTVGTSTAKWFYFAANGFVGDDGSTTTGHGGLAVIPKGTNPATGLPAFAKTVAQEQVSGLPGGFDHVKWLVYMNHLASSGYPGFDAQPGQQLVCQSTVSGQVFGTQPNPFGAAVTKPYDDPRLAAVAMNVIDFQTFMVFDVFYTDTHIYALYEHLPFARKAFGGAYDNYAAFTYTIPIATRAPGDFHTVSVAYDKGAGTVRWLVDGQQRFSWNQIGHRLPDSYRQNQILDHGGVDETFTPNQLDCGMGMFTLLDGHGPQNEGLVALSSVPGFYFNPTVQPYETVAETFVDSQSLASSRLFGQGAALEVRNPSVGYIPSN